MLKDCGFLIDEIFYFIGKALRVTQRCFMMNKTVRSTENRFIKVGNQVNSK